MLRVHTSKRFLCDETGTPFFYLADTAWELFHRLTREEAEAFLRDRAAKGYTAIQAVVLAEFDGLRVPNAYGELPLVDLDPARPNEKYFAHVDWIVRKADELGLYVAMLPTWGDKWNGKWGNGPVIFNAGNAQGYGEFLGRRYRDAKIIWVLGGDRAVENDEQRRMLRAMAAGLSAGDGGTHLRTLHPCGGKSSGEFVHDEPWLDFNMAQSGHTDYPLNYEFMKRDYAREPIKPCLDAEPCYENHPVMGAGWKATEAWYDEFEVRRAAYWAVFSGACGHTYGCHDIWQMHDAKRSGVNRARTPWQEAMNLPGSKQMGYVRALIESRPFFTRVPDDGLLMEGQESGHAHLAATRDGTLGRNDASYLCVYFPGPSEAAVNTRLLAVPQVRAWWFDPRTGRAEDLGTSPNRGQWTVTRTPGREDWVLVLDDAAREYAAPGTKAKS
jgi:hypothetical protein